ncbi:hypothetical protein J6590_019211 [Homalodisca vitripennis]|nr:hypothetical protein J6590_019211 [Homalodisca vitripennis]
MQLPNKNNINKHHQTGKMCAAKIKQQMTVRSREWNYIYILSHLCLQGCFILLGNHKPSQNLIFLKLLVLYYPVDTEMFPKNGKTVPTPSFMFSGAHCPRTPRIPGTESERGFSQGPLTTPII